MWVEIGNCYYLAYPENTLFMWPCLQLLVVKKRFEIVVEVVFVRLRVQNCQKFR